MKPPSLFHGLTDNAVGHRSKPHEFKVRRGMSEGCFVFQFASLPLELSHPIQPTLCPKVVVKHETSPMTLLSSYAQGMVLFESFQQNPQSLSTPCHVFLLVKGPYTDVIYHIPHTQKKENYSTFCGCELRNSQFLVNHFLR